MRLVEILGHVEAFPRLGVRRADELKVLVDTSGLKWLSCVGDIECFRRGDCGNDYNVVVTSGVMKQVEELIGRNPEVFAPALKKYIDILDPNVVRLFASAREEEDILRACYETYNGANGGIPDIGWVDMNQIAWMIRGAKRDKKTVMVTDDGCLRDVVNYLRRQDGYMLENVLTASILRYNNHLLATGRDGLRMVV